MPCGISEEQSFPKIFLIPGGDRRLAEMDPHPLGCLVLYPMG